MYDLNRNSYFTTLGELRMLLSDIPDDVEVYVGGTDAYLHVATDKSYMSFDCDDLWDSYQEFYDITDEEWEEQQALIMEKHKMRLAAIAAEKENKKTKKNIPSNSYPPTFSLLKNICQENL